jgi:hypothetical protein
METLWKNLVTVSGDPLFGLPFGESLQLAALGVVGQIIQWPLSEMPIGQTQSPERCL